MLVPLMSFWWLDTFFLRTERMYRKMYEWVLKNRGEGNAEKLYDLNPKRFEDQVKSRKEVMTSETLRWFYGIPVAIVVAILVFQTASIVISWLPKHDEDVLRKKPAAQTTLNTEAPKDGKR